jgi:uncharacterized protein (TIGR02271 family)
MEPSTGREPIDQFDPYQSPPPNADPRTPGRTGQARQPRRRAEGWGAAGPARRPGPPVDRTEYIPLPPGAFPPGEYVPPPHGAYDALGEQAQTVELREEELVAHKELQEVGQISIRTELEEIPGRLEVDACREEVEVEHVPVDRPVTERVAPWEEDGVLVVPVYEEQLVVVKRLVMREQLRVRRVGVTEKRLCEQPLLRERLIVEDADQTGLIREQYPNPATGDRSAADAREPTDRRRPEQESGSLLENLARKVGL